MLKYVQGFVLSPDGRTSLARPLARGARGASLRPPAQAQTLCLHPFTSLCPFLPPQNIDSHLAFSNSTMGANQSGPQNNPTNPDQSTHSITVVHSVSADKVQRQNEIVLPARVPPILDMNTLEIDPERHKQQLNHQLWLDQTRMLNEYVQSRSNFVASRQTRLQEKIVLVDRYVQNFTDSYVNDKHQLLARMNEDCKRVEEINKQLHRCNIQAEICLDMLNKLNFLLPQEHRLEPLETS